MWSNESSGGSVMAANGSSLNRLAFSATAHCLTGCAIGEVLGMVIGTALGWGDFATIALAVVLAFFFGYSLTMVPLLRSGLALAVVLPLALAHPDRAVRLFGVAEALSGKTGAVPSFPATQARLRHG